MSENSFEIWNRRAKEKASAPMGHRRTSLCRVALPNMVRVSLVLPIYIFVTSEVLHVCMQMLTC